MIYLQLFFSFLQIGALSFGGGYAALPLIQNQVVNYHHWLSTTEFTDLITISQMTPGPIAINSATFVGVKIAGIPGAIVSTLGCVLPSCIIVTIIVYVYIKYSHFSIFQNVLQYLRPAVVSFIASAGLSILVTAFFGNDFVSLYQLKIHMAIIFLICLYLLFVKKMDPIIVMILAGLINVLQAFIF